MEKKFFSAPAAKLGGRQHFPLLLFLLQKSLLLRVTRRHTPSFHRKLQQAKNEDGDKCVFKNTH